MRYFLIILFFCVQVVYGVGQSRSLDFYLETSKSRHAELTDYLNRQQIAKIENQKVKADFHLPNIYTQTQWMEAPLFNGNGYDEAITNGALYSAVAGVSYPLLTGNMVSAYTRQNDLSGAYSEWNYDARWNELKKQVTEQYLTCYFDGMILQNVQEQYTLLQRQYETAEPLAKEGIIKGSELLLIKIEMQQQQLAISEIKAQRIADFIQLNQLCNISDTVFYGLMEPNLRLTDIDTSDSRFLVQYDLDKLMNANQQEIFNIKYQPRLSLFGDAGLNATSLDQPQKNLGFSFGLNFSIVLFDGHQKKIDAQQTEIRQETVQAYRDNFQNQQTQNLNKYSELIRLADIKIEQIKEQLSSYNELLSIYKKGMQLGEVTVTEYLIIFRNFIQSRVDLIDQQKQKYNAINEYNYWNW